MGISRLIHSPVAKIVAGILIVIIAASAVYALLAKRQKPLSQSGSVATATPTPSPTSSPTSSASPSSGIDYKQQAAAEYQNKQYDKAIADYRLAIQATSSTSEQASLWNLLGNTYRDSEAPDQAITAYRQSISLDAQVTDPYINLANLYVSKGNYTEAEAILQSGLSANPNNAKLQDALAVVQMHGVNATR